MADPPANTRRKSKKGYLWVTFFFFAISLIGHWVFAWFTYANEQEQHGQPIEGQSFFNEVMAATLENWQSEFLQLCWQVAGLSFLWYVGSPQSKESDDRKEEKLDRILEKLYGDDDAKKIKADLASKYPKQ